MGCFHDVMIIKPRSEPRIYGKHLFSFSVFFFQIPLGFFFLSYYRLSLCIF